MNNENLKPFKKGEQRARDCAIKGNKKKQELHLFKKTIKEAIKDNLTEEDMTEICKNLIERAKVDTKAFEFLRDTLGEKPKDKTTIEYEQPIFIDNLED